MSDTLETPVRRGVAVLITHLGDLEDSLRTTLSNAQLSVCVLDSIFNLDALLPVLKPKFIICSGNKEMVDGLSTLVGELIFHQEYSSIDQALECHMNSSTLQCIFIDHTTKRNLVYFQQDANLREQTFTLCDKTFSLIYSSTSIPFTSAEFIILHYLMKNKDLTVSKGELSERALRRSAHPDDRSIDVHICRIRKKVRPLFGDNVIRSVRGAGYIYSSNISGILSSDI